MINIALYWIHFHNFGSCFNVALFCCKIPLWSECYSKPKSRWNHLCVKDWVDVNRRTGRSDHYGIWRASRQHRSWWAYQLSNWYLNSGYIFCGIEFSVYDVASDVEMHQQDIYVPNQQWVTTYTSKNPDATSLDVRTFVAAYTLVDIRDGFNILTQIVRLRYFTRQGGIWTMHESVKEQLLFNKMRHEHTNIPPPPPPPTPPPPTPPPPPPTPTHPASSAAYTLGPIWQ